MFNVFDQTLEMIAVKSKVFLRKLENENAIKDAMRAYDLKNTD